MLGMGMFSWRIRYKVLFERVKNILVPGVVLVGILSIGWWLTANPVRDLSVSKPGMDNRGDAKAYIQDVDIGGIFNEMGASSNELSGVWPAFRGENQDNISASQVDLIDKFKDTIPEILWTKELGEGHSGAVIYKGIVYVLDYDEEEGADLLRSFDLISGEEIWQRGYHVHVKRNHGKSRTIPAVTEKYIVTMGPKGHVMCVDRETGDFRWGLDLIKDYKTEIPLWYTGQCPIIDNGVAVIASCGTSLMLGIDCETGDIIWETPNPDGWLMSHSSIMIMEFAGRRMYLYSAVSSAVFAVYADGAEQGQIAWYTEKWKHDVVAASPVVLPDGKIFLSAAYGTGCMVLQLKESNGVFVTEVIDEYKPSEGLSSDQQTPIYFDGHLFCILPKYAASRRMQFACVNPANFREMVWTSGKSVRFGDGWGPFILADGKFFLLNDDGTLSIVRASSKRFELLDQVKVFKEGHDAWAPIAIADGYMVLRDSKEMACINLNK